MRYSLTILDEHYQRLRSLLLHDENENGVLLSCGRSMIIDPWTGILEERALVREIVELPKSAFYERTPVSMCWSTTPLYNLAKRNIPKAQAICIAHSHPHGRLAFSELDDVADKESFEIVFSRMESERPHFSLIMNSEGEIIVRAYGPDLRPQAVELVKIIGNSIKLFYPGRGKGFLSEEFDRNVIAFGAEAFEDLRQLRIGIVGCGGTGSAVASLLARLGISRMLLIDNDKIEMTNLNRLHLSKRCDAIEGRNKAEVLKKAIAEIGLVNSVVSINKYIDDPECRDAIRSCDVIFGCTDDHLGRNFLNRIAYFYLIPVIDLGVLIQPSEGGGYDCFDGRVTVIQPGNACQLCRHLIDPQTMLEETLHRNDPELFRKYAQAGYVHGGTDPSPAVVTFTTEMACVAVNELLHRLIGFRGSEGGVAERVRCFTSIKEPDCIPGCNRNPDCPLCVERRYDGRGDMSPFLDMA